MLAKTLIAN